MIRLTGWTRAAARFIDPPAFTWEPVPGVTDYRITWSAGAVRGASRVTEPGFSFATDWSRVPEGRVDWALEAGADRAAFSFHRVPDFDGRTEAPLDWAAAARRNLDWLLALPDDPDTGEPWWLTHSWHGHPADLVIAYPALHYPSFVDLFLTALQAESDPARRDRLQAALVANRAAILRWRTSPGGAAGGLPMTTRVTRNPGVPRAEEGTISLFRTARLGEALLALHAHRPDPECLAYARHIAATLVRLQRADGSWPYRIRPDSGEVTDPYTSAGISTARFLLALGERDAAERAIGWTLAGPCRTGRWQGMYEDVGTQEPFANLENWDALDAIRILADRDIAAAAGLNRWVEDQFVVFGPSGLPASTGHVPAVLEQFVCAYPMEVHTARWLEALRDLERATGDPAYGIKAVRAANAIVRAQFPDGRFSTWGRDAATGRPFNDEGDWYGCNAIAAAVLLRSGRSV